VKYWEIIEDRLHAEGWSYGIAEHLTKHGFLYCVDAHRDGKRPLRYGSTIFHEISKARRGQALPSAPGKVDLNFLRIKRDFSIGRWFNYCPYEKAGRLPSSNRQP
jgi:hypothetical protein